MLDWDLGVDEVDLVVETLNLAGLWSSRSYRPNESSALTSSDDNARVISRRRAALATRLLPWTWIGELGGVAGERVGETGVSMAWVGHTRRGHTGLSGRRTRRSRGYKLAVVATALPDADYVVTHAGDWAPLEWEVDVA